MNKTGDLTIDFNIPSIPGTERQAMERIAEAVGDRLEGERLERLKTAVSEAVLNAIEHGNHNRPDLMVHVQILSTEESITIRITDHGGGQPIPEYTIPNIEAKLAGLEKPRGWGLFLIKHMVDEMHIHTDQDHHTLELIFYMEKREDEQQSS